MNIHQELEKARRKYGRAPMAALRLPCPMWLTEKDPLHRIFKEKDRLLSSGQIFLARIVQANTLLFHKNDHDCPASIIYSTDPAAELHPELLDQVAGFLYLYKDKPLEDIPEQWRSIARVITDEYDRETFVFSVPWENRSIEFRFLPIMIFRRLIPGGVLNGTFLPILALPDICGNALVLPKKYWPFRFQFFWSQHKL